MASAKPRQQRLRASCDGCFLAKVKCSKARPICSRCLACGIECRYSPSSRTGKPKSDSNASLQSSMAADISAMSPVSDDTKGIVYQNAVPRLYKLETGWQTPPTSVDGGMSRSHSMSGLALMGIDTSPVAPADAAMVADMYAAGIPWTPPNDMSGQFVESPNMAAHMGQGHARSQSYDYSMGHPMGQWSDPNHQDMYAFTQAQLPTPGSMQPTYFPSPTATPQIRPSPRHKPAPIGSSGSSASCTCFTACLQSLQALHNASSPANPPFDLVLSLNRKAVEGCASMLSCQRCMSRSGTHTAAMLLATVIGKITSFYKNASHTYFENGSMQPAASPNALGVSLGGYTLMGEDGRWLEMEILVRELRKLEEVYAQFREVCADLSEDPEVSKAMIGYLSHTLGSTLEVVHHRKGDVSTYA